MKTTIPFFLISFFLTLTQLVAIPPECRPELGTSWNECFRIAYQSQDLKLNSLFSSLITQLDQNQIKEIRSNSLTWIRVKEGTCSFQYKEQQNDPLGFQRCLFNQTINRIDFLNSYFLHRNDTQIEGTYSDGYSGSIRLSLVNQNIFLFSLDTVSSPSSHIGHYDGVMRIIDGPVLYSDPSNSSNSECKLRIEIMHAKVTIEEIACSGYHGARARFDGLYFKIQ